MYYIDLSNAFDALNNDMLFQKFSYYFVRGSEPKLFNNYQSNRQNTIH